MLRKLVTVATRSFLCGFSLYACAAEEPFRVSDMPVINRYVNFMNLIGKEGVSKQALTVGEAIFDDHLFIYDLDAVPDCLQVSSRDSFFGGLRSLLAGEKYQWLMTTHLLEQHRDGWWEFSALFNFVCGQEKDKTVKLFLSVHIAENGRIDIIQQRSHQE